MKKSLLFALLPLLAACSYAPKTPQTSSLFEKWTDPESGVVSYKLKDNLLAPNQQSVYFVNKSMTDDGRFLFFWTADDERLKENRKDGMNRRNALVDFKEDKVFDLGMKCGIDYLDVRTDKLYYINTEGVFVRELLVDPLAEIKLCDIPEGLKAEGPVTHFYTHLTLNHDRTKFFIDTRVNGTDRWIQGVIDITNGTWEKWNETDFVINHGQIHPVRDDISLCAHETSWYDAAGGFHRIQNVNGIYPRLQLIEPGNRRTMVPPLDGYATHERWDEQGNGFYWCGKKAVTYCDLKTMEQYVIAPFGDHAMLSDDGKYVVSDYRIGPFFRGADWTTLLWSRDRGRLTYLASTMPGLATPENQSVLHPDPHPQFVCNDRYAVWTMMGRDTLMHLMVTPMDGVRKVLDRKPIGDLPQECSPETIALKLAEQLVSTEPEAYKPVGYDEEGGMGSGKHVHYSVTSLWVNALQVAFKLGNHDLRFRLGDMAYKFFHEKEHLLNRDNHVDFSVFGAVPLEVYREKAGKHDADGVDRGSEWLAMKTLGLHYADNQWAGAEENGGHSPQVRLWIDDMYMISLLQIQAYRATGDFNYVSRTADEMVYYLEKLQQDNGLFCHSGESPYFWGRGNGWMAAAMPMILRYLSPDDARYEPILAGYRKMMTSLLGYQHPDGLWGQLIDDGQSWGETSCTAMFTYAFIEGINHGWLPAKEYVPAARKAWIKLCSMLDEYGNISDVCIGTNAKNDRQWYLDRPVRTGDPHGQAAMMWICNALL